MAYPWKKCVENYRERLSEKVGKDYLKKYALLKRGTLKKNY